MQLFEKHRPKSLDDVVGQSETVFALKTLLFREFTGGTFYLSGASGTGKTTLARALVNELSIDPNDLTEVGGADCTVEFVRALVDNFQLATWGESGWKCCIVDEAHAMTPRAVQAWLPFLEALPSKRLVVFTSTEALSVRPEEFKLDTSEVFGQYTRPFASRCKEFRLSLDLEAAAAHVSKIASAENLNGQPFEAYRALLADCRGNLRQAFQRIESGEMLRQFVAQAVTLDAPAAPVTPKQRIASVPAASGDLEARIAAEIAYGARFLPGTKNPRYLEHKARLAALESERAK